LNGERHWRRSDPFAVKNGAKVVTGGERSALSGSFFEPAVLTDVTTAMIITKEETFGPRRAALSLQGRGRGEPDGQRHPTLTLSRLRGSEGRGLAAYFSSRDIGRIWRVAEAREYGIVGINEGIISPNPPARSRRSAA
jgi:succinate-semialdehyde dehydrogenase/glutarate-semialdehyde dehydrogenase